MSSSGLAYAVSLGWPASWAQSSRQSPGTHPCRARDAKKVSGALDALADWIMAQPCLSDILIAVSVDIVLYIMACFARAGGACCFEDLKLHTPAGNDYIRRSNMSTPMSAAMPDAVAAPHASSVMFIDIMFASELCRCTCCAAFMRTHSASRALRK